MELRRFLSIGRVEVLKQTLDAGTGARKQTCLSASLSKAVIGIV